MPILTVPVLTPRLSSYWISFVTDVDTTTGRNLIDSMGTEVIVTDHAIRDMVPGEPMTYAEAVRRAVAEARLNAGLRRAAAARAASSATRCTWVIAGARTPPDGAPLEADHQAEQDGGEDQHHVAGGER